MRSCLATVFLLGVSACVSVERHDPIAPANPEPDAAETDGDATAPIPEPDGAPAPEPEVSPDTVPSSEPAPSPEPAADPDPVPAPDGAHDAAPDGEQDAAPDADRDPAPEPDSEPAACVPDCAGKSCGPDGCGGACGVCDAGVCVGGACKVPGSGNDDCGEVLACLSGCVEDLACGAGCYAEGSPEGASEAFAWWECFAAAGCGDGAAGSLCAAEHCAGEVAACSAGATGDGTCWQVAECMGSCPKSPPSANQGCTLGCVDAGSAEAQAKVMAFSLCLEGTCGKAPDKVCQEAAYAEGGACYGYLAACLSDGCAASCPPSDPICVDGACTGGAGGACTNAADLALIEDDGCSEVPSPGTTCEAGEALVCGQGCLASPDPKQCGTECVVDETALSAPCAACYADEIPCAVASGCVAACLQDEVKCSACRCEKGCTKAFYDCSGLDSSASTCENL